MPRYWATPEGLAVAAAAAGVVTLLLYGNSVDGALVWDDVPALVDNRDVRGGPGNPIVALLWRDFWGFDLHSSISHKVRPLVQLHQHPGMCVSHTSAGPLGCWQQSNAPRPVSPLSASPAADNRRASELRRAESLGVCGRAGGRSPRSRSGCSTRYTGCGRCPTTCSTWPCMRSPPCW
jgi:hypothetical protein